MRLKKNWNPKSVNIIDISKELNIGTDSLIFIDNNPFECGQVSSILPEVDTYCLNGSPTENLLLILNIKYIDFLNLTSEDLKKSESYLLEQRRNDEKNSFNDVNDYLASLNIKITITEVNDNNIDRVVQLINKTNQFNMTTKRYTKQEVLDLLSNNYTIYSLGVSDKFGDYGLVGVAILERQSNILKIHNLLLGCRVLKRKIEHNFISFIYEKSLSNINELHGYYVESAKNTQVKNFYTELGFNYLEDQNCFVYNFEFPILKDDLNTLTI
ncbi:MAG: hypothetical protein ACK5LY_07375 [Lachnospirales bacterium]